MLHVLLIYIMPKNNASSHSASYPHEVQRVLRKIDPNLTPMLLRQKYLLGFNRVRYEKNSHPSSQTKLVERPFLRAMNSERK